MSDESTEEVLPEPVQVAPKATHKVESALPKEEKVNIASPTSKPISPPPKKAVFSLADLESEVVNQKVETKEKVEEKTEEEVSTEEALPFNERNLYGAWQKMLQEFATGPLVSLQEMLNDKQPEIEGADIVIELDSNIEKQYVEKNMLTITRFLRSKIELKSPHLLINVNQNEQNRKVILNQKDKYRKLLDKHPHLKSLTDSLGLELEL